MVTEDDIRRIAEALPGAYEQPSYEQRPSWRTQSRMFAWLPRNLSALVVWVESVEEKLAMIASEPHKFFTTPHYDGQPIILVRPAAIDSTEAEELITESWRLRASKSLVKQWARERQG